MNFGEYARAFFKHALECKTSETVLPGCANQRKQMVNKKGANRKEPAFFETAESLSEFTYDGFCGANLSKYMIKASKEEGKTLVFLKPCDTYSFNQLIKEHRVDREKTYIVGIGEVFTFCK